MRLLPRFMLGILTMIVLMFMAERYYTHTSGEAGKEIINFYNWGDYIDPEVLKEFEAETGYKIIYETFDSNEAMITKIRQGGTSYDLVVPSEFMVEVMKQEDLLIPLDHSLIPHQSNLNPRFLNMPFDPDNKYSLPYFWGTLGIVYNTKTIPEGTISDWEDLWRPEFQNRILMTDGAREVMGIGLQNLGYSLNDTNEDHLLEASRKLKQLMPNLMAMITDEIKMHLVNGETDIGVTYSGEAGYVVEHNPDFKYLVPKGGSCIWTDNFVIPKTADNIEGAHALIDFLCRDDIAARNAEYITYATPNLAAEKLLDPKVVNDPSMYPRGETLDHLEAYKNLGQETLIRYNDLYLEMKIEPTVQD